jgi:hypothetical protein
MLEGEDGSRRPHFLCQLIFSITSALTVGGK